MRRRRAAVLVVGLAAVSCAAGCGIIPGTASPAGPVDGGGAPAVAAGGDVGGVDGGAACAIDAGDLSAATGLTWELRFTMADHPLETLESVMATACVYTTDDRHGEYGDPLALRVDLVDGGDAATLRTHFEEVCADTGGTVTASSAVDGAALCDRDGVVQEGNVTVGGTSVDVYYPLVDRSQLGEVTSSFEQVLGTVRM